MEKFVNYVAPEVLSARGSTTQSSQSTQATATSTVSAEPVAENFTFGPSTSRSTIALVPAGLHNNSSDLPRPSSTNAEQVNVTQDCDIHDGLGDESGDLNDYPGDRLCDASPQDAPDPCNSTHGIDALKHFDPQLEEIMANYFDTVRYKILDEVDYNYACAILQESPGKQADYPVRFCDSIRRHNFRRKVTANYEFSNNALCKKSEYGLQPVATTKNCCRLICEAHLESEHKGAEHVYQLLLTRVAMVSRPAIRLVVNHCSICHGKPRVRSYMDMLPPSTFFRTFKRVDVDFIDFRNSKSLEFSWVFIVRDCSSLYIWLWALIEKEPLEIAQCLESLLPFRLPIFFRCNTSEVKDAVSSLMEKHGTENIGDEPRSRGHARGIKRATIATKSKIEAWMRDNERSDWSNSLTDIAQTWNLNPQAKSFSCWTPRQILKAALRYHNQNSIDT